MNYIGQIKGFWIAQEAYQLGSSEIALYFYLLEVCNKTGWLETFNRDNSKIMSDLSIKSYKTLTSIRMNLNNAGVIVFVQKNGNGNAAYSIIDLGKKYQGSSEKNTEVDAKPLVKNTNPSVKNTNPLVKNTEQLGKKYRDNINYNKTFIKQSKTSKSHSGEAPDEEKNELLFWKGFVGVWNEWYKSKFNESYIYLEKDFAHLKKIYLFMQKRAKVKKFEFTEENLLAAFKFFLQSAWDKSEWIQKNFSIPNLLSQFNQIVNGQQQSTSNNYRQQPTGSNVSTASAFSKIDRMFDKVGS